MKSISLAFALVVGAVALPAFAESRPVIGFLCEPIPEDVLDE